MENFFASVFYGFSEVVGKLLGHPLDFLSGKSCSSKCGSTWDFFCYIENFCISHLLKLALVFILLYFVLLFFYLSYKLGLCQCICHTLCRSIWACFATYFSLLEWCCTFICFKLQKHSRQRRRRERDLEDLTTISDSEYDEGSISFREPKHIEVARRNRRPRDLTTNSDTEDDEEGSISFREPKHIEVERRRRKVRDIDDLTTISDGEDDEGSVSYRGPEYIEVERMRRRRRRMKDIEDLTSSDREDCEGNISFREAKHIDVERKRRLRSRRGRDYKKEHLRTALRPKSHRMHVGIRCNSVHLRKRNSKKHHDHVSPLDHIRVDRTSKFAQKRGTYKSSMRYWRN